jgi:hypothetical protein
MRILLMSLRRGIVSSKSVRVGYIRLVL